MLDYKDVLGVLATLVASFSGAWGAFLLENQRRLREQSDKNVGAANRAVYTIFNLWNTLENVRKQVLEPHRGRTDAWLNMAAQPGMSTGDHRFQADNLQFLLEGPCAHLYAALFLEEQRFNFAINLLRERDQLVLSEVFPRLSKAGYGPGKSGPQEEVERAIGVDVVHKLKVITGALYTNIDENLASLRTRHDELRKAIEELYPGKKLARVQFGVSSE